MTFLSIVIVFTPPHFRKDSEREAKALNVEFRRLLLYFFPLPTISNVFFFPRSFLLLLLLPFFLCLRAK